MKIPGGRSIVMRSLTTIGIVLFVGLMALVNRSQPPVSLYAQANYSMRFFGNAALVNDQDRVKIALGPVDVNGQISASRPVNVGDNLTIEFWMKAAAANNPAGSCNGANQGWYYGNIIIDRDVYGDAVPDYGIAICAGRIVFGVNGGNDDNLLVGATNVTDDQWRHIAVTRDATTGVLQLFVDGQLDGTYSGPTGSIAYPLNRATDWPNSDPYLVFGAEKHDYPGSLYYTGLLDDLRLSNTVRYTTSFTRPTGPHPLDAATVALYRFDEGSGTAIGDATSGNASPGILNPRSGGAAQHWSTDTPFGSAASPTPTASLTLTPSLTPSLSPTTIPSATSAVAPSATSAVAPSATSAVAPSATSAMAPSATSEPTLEPTQDCMHQVDPTPTPTVATQTPERTSDPAPQPNDDFSIFLPLLTCA